MASIEKRLARLIASGGAQALRGGLVGLEKESLRVTVQGGIAQSSHPRALGSALTHPYITTDYSEALTEFITPPLASIEAALAFLGEIQKFTYAHLNDEILWAASMPCVLAGVESIPIAQYGPSNLGMMKTVYRRGLGRRYGRIMQVIAGVHFNYSPPQGFWVFYRDLLGTKVEARELIDEAFLGQIRNLQRQGWLIPYLFGASPAVCKSFLDGKPTPLDEFDTHTYYAPYGTSLRMGDIGYTNRKEEGCGIKADYDSLESYVAALIHAIETPCPAWERIGVKVDGRYEQLNANILQIENEYYSTVRPKQVPDGNEKPSLALRRRGVRYVELRSLDVNPFEPAGINAGQLRFLEAFMLLCLLQDSPRIDARERCWINDNLIRVAQQGREPGLVLQRNGGMVALRDWALEICDSVQGVCELLDADQPGQPYAQALLETRQMVEQPELTPSARVLAEMRAQGEGFFRFARRQSLRHQAYFDGLELNAQRRAFFEQEAARSLEAQAAIEAADTQSFDDFLSEYFCQR